MISVGGHGQDVPALVTAVRTPSSKISGRDVGVPAMVEVREIQRRRPPSAPPLVIMEKRPIYVTATTFVS
jgi:hypothetical protein